MKFITRKQISFINTIILAAIFTAPGYAQNDAGTTIENSIRTIGSAKAIAGVRNIRAVADCTGPNGNYTTEIYSAVNSRLVFRQIRAGNVYKGTTNGPIFWTTDEKTGDDSLAGKKAAFAWRSHDYQRLAIEVSQWFRDISFEAEEIFAGKAAFKLRAKDELGNPAYLFFDKDSRSMLGFVIQNPFSEKPETIRNVFNEWKQVGKLKLPSKITVTDKQGDFVLNFKDISLNKLDESVFSVPRTVVAMTELLEAHNKARADHFNRDAAAMVSGFAEDFTSIANGKVQKPERKASLARFRNYFANSTFLEWDDITPPVIKVSGDATMAYVIVHKRVRLLSRGDDGKTTEQTEVFAWVALYRKVAGQWKLTAVASTNTPEEDK